MDPVSPIDARLDHLVFAVPDLDEGVAMVQDLLRVETAPGGRHVGLGTRNRLVGLGGARYLEIVSVDPDQPTPARPRWFGLDDLSEPRLVTWCAKASELGALAARARRGGVELGEPVAGSRDRPDGSRLSWTFTDPWADRAGGVVPFFIDWGASVHPASGLRSTCAFRSLRIEHPEAADVDAVLRTLGLDMQVSEGDAPRLVASLDTPAGIVELS